MRDDHESNQDDPDLERDSSRSRGERACFRVGPRAVQLRRGDRGAVLSLYYPPYYYYPPAVVVPAAPTTYIEKDSAHAAPPQRSYWYYCEGSKTYYPYVKECPGGWLRVVPQATPPATPQATPQATPKRAPRTPPQETAQSAPG